MAELSEAHVEDKNIWIPPSGWLQYEHKPLPLDISSGMFISANSSCADWFQMMSLELDGMCGATIVQCNCPTGGRGDKVIKMILPVLISMLTG